MINKLSVIPTVLVLKIWLNKGEDILGSLVSPDELLIEELFNHGLFKLNEILNKHTLVWEERIKWNNENYEALKKFLNQFISLIHKACPYIGITSHRIYEEFEELFIYNWIDRNDSVTLSNNNKCKFNLVTSMMSRDGHNSETLHNICNELVVLIRVQSKKIYGGYNLSNWMSRSLSGYNVYNYENIFGRGEEGETPIIDEIEVFITIKK
ncbi:hypothetical protein RhiirC2_791626 [Rhizophagus irregularis]|uniref:TLDc domain-containing protein n=1 Tax=Rhizophagus irregularis TaxID=588596 RepID=A0A2N1MIV8_9GLOM|nr:hypothetical protein RhiirC2_791626 [Rhizophagus irregularis]